MRRGLLHGAVLAVAVACQGGGYFVCDDDGDCATADGGGVCQPEGACSFHDDTCPSGQRYGAAGEPSLAGQCVGADASSTGLAEDPSTTGPGGAPSTGDAPPGESDSTGDGCPDGWWDCAWAHRQRLELARPLDATLTDVPVLVLLTAGRVDHERMQADGEDVRLVSASGTVAPYEIERWDPEGVSMLWFTVDELGGAADHLWLYYGNPVAESAEDPEAVWPEPFVGVWHLEDEPIDATAEGNDAMATASTAVLPGHIGNGHGFPTYNARLDVAPSPSVNDLFAGGGTVSAWIRARGWGGGGYGRILDKQGGTSTGWLLFVASGGRLRLHAWVDPEAESMWITAPDAIGLHRWIHVAVSYDALEPALPRFYVDGVEVELAEPEDPPVAAELPSDLELPLTIGNRSANDRRFDGILDEVRLERVVRSPEWIAVQHDSMRDALLRYGPIESWEGGS